MKPLLHKPAGQILYRPADQKRYGKSRAVSRFIRGKSPDRQGNQHRAAAVYRTDRTGKKTAIDEAVKLDIFECYLRAPAQKRISKKEQNQINGSFHILPLILRRIEVNG